MNAGAEPAGQLSDGPTPGPAAARASPVGERFEELADSSAGRRGVLKVGAQEASRPRQAEGRGSGRHFCLEG